jgi:hypothetical protein
MTRPSQPSQEDVKKATDIVNAWYDTQAGLVIVRGVYFDNLVTRIATAIMQARRETVEKCAKLAEKDQREWKRVHAESEEKEKLGTHMAFIAARSLARSIRALLDEEAK